MTSEPLDETALTACPFCGSAEYLMVADYEFPPDDDGDAWKWGRHVVCSAAGLDNVPHGCGCSSAWGETSAEAIAAWNRRSPLAASVPVTVKGLEWAQYSSHATANSVVGQYQILHDLVSDPPEFSVRHDSSPFAFCPTYDEAKAAAQADYEKRILSALSSLPAGAVGVETRRKAMAAAIKAGEAAYMDAPDDTALITCVRTAIEAYDAALLARALPDSSATADLADWSSLPKDIYVVSAKSHSGIAFDVVCCSVPMVTAPEVRYTRADLATSPVPSTALVEALERGCYLMSEPHLSGHRVILGFEKLKDAQDAMTAVAAALAAHGRGTQP